MCTEGHWRLRPTRTAPPPASLPGRSRRRTLGPTQCSHLDYPCTLYPRQRVISKSPFLIDDLRKSRGLHSVSAYKVPGEIKRSRDLEEGKCLRGWTCINYISSSCPCIHYTQFTMSSYCPYIHYIQFTISSYCPYIHYTKVSLSLYCPCIHDTQFTISSR